MKAWQLVVVGVLVWTAARIGCLYLEAKGRAYELEIACRALQGRVRDAQEQFGGMGLRFDEQSGFWIKEGDE